MIETPDIAKPVLPRAPRSLWSRYRTAIAFASSAVLVHGASAIANVALMRWVGPTDMGVWQALTLAQTYLGIVRVGVVNGLNREYPFLKGKGDEHAANTIAGTARFHCLVSALLGFGYFVYAALDGGERERLASLCMAAVSAAQFYRSYLEGTLRGSAQFRWFSRVNTITGTLQLASLPLVAFGGFRAMCARFVVLELIGLALLHVGHPALVPPRPTLASYRKLFATGIPLFLSNYLLATSGTFGRVYVLARGGTEELGLFHTTISVQGALGMVPSAIILYLAPRYAQQFGKDGDPGVLARKAVRNALMVLAGLVPLAAAGWLLMPLVAATVLPLYVKVVWEMRLALITGLFGASQVALAAFAATKAWKPMAVFIGAAVALRFAAPYAVGLWQPNVVRAAAVGGVLAESVLFVVALMTVHSIGRSIRRAETGAEKGSG